MTRFYSAAALLLLSSVLFGGDLVLGFLALIFAHLVVAFTHDQALRLPVADLLATAILVLRLRGGREERSLALLPPFATVTALAAAWALTDLQPEWWPLFGGIAMLGYLATAHFDVRGSARGWGAAAGGAAVVTFWLTFAAQFSDGVSPRPMPAALGIALGGAVIASLHWRWEWPEAVATIPALAAGTALATAWAASTCRSSGGAYSRASPWRATC